MRVVCISAECEPWAKTGGLGDVVDALTRAVGARGPGGQEVEAGIPHTVQSQVWVGTGAVMGVGDIAYADHVERPVDLFLQLDQLSPAAAGRFELPDLAQFDRQAPR